MGQRWAARAWLEVAEDRSERDELAVERVSGESGADPDLTPLNRPAFVTRTQFTPILLTHTCPAPPPGAQPCPCSAP